MLHCTLYHWITIHVSFLSWFSRSMVRNVPLGVPYQSHTAQGGLPIRERRTTDDETVVMRPQDGLLERRGRSDSRNVTGVREWNFPIDGSYRDFTGFLSILNDGCKADTRSEGESRIKKAAAWARRVTFSF